MSQRHQSTVEDRIVRMPELRQIVGLGVTAIYDAIKHNGFPKPIKLTERASGWRLSAVERWLTKREAASRRSAA
jgi:prophage regulatory protein